MVTGIDVIHHAGQIVIIDGNGKPLIAMSPDAADVFVMRAIEAIRAATGKDPVAFRVLAELLTKGS